MADNINDTITSWYQNKTATGAAPATAATPTGTGLLSTAAPSALSTASNGATTLNTAGLSKRSVDPLTETVSGQMDKLTAQNSPYMEQARQGAVRTANERGLLNSTMAASGGEYAAIQSALPIAQADASVYGKAADYNTALTNQANQYNADATNTFGTNALNRGAQTDIAKLQSDTSRFVAEQNNATSRYNTDADYRKAMDNNRNSMINNILLTTDLAPDRKAALLQQLGAPGLASAIHVVDSTSADLAPASGTPYYANYSD